jgi:site-specific DNA recombinase
VKVIGYIRVSTLEQATEGISLEMQRKRIEQWATLNDGEVLAIHEDAGISGSSMKHRPGLAAALDSAGKGCALVTYSISRLARSTKDMIAISERLAAQGADLVSLTEKIDTSTAAGKMIFRMLAVLAEFERDVTSERTRAALSALKAKGVKLGSPTPGAGGQAAHDAAFARDLLIMGAIGDGPLHSRAARLNAAGHRTAQGKLFTKATISRILARQRRKS